MEDYSKKYDKLLSSENTYQFLLKIQKDIARIARNKNIKEFYNLLSFFISASLNAFSAVVNFS